MLTNIENHSWIIILPVFGLLFMVIWNSLKSGSIFPEPTCFVISLCVAILCIVSVIEYFPQGHGNSQEVAAVSQKDVSSQEPQQRNFFFLLLPYLALAISIISMFFLLMLLKIKFVIKKFFKPSRCNKDNITTMVRRANKPSLELYLEKNRNRNIR